MTHPVCCVHRCHSGRCKLRGLEKRYSSMTGVASSLQQAFHFCVLCCRSQARWRRGEAVSLKAARDNMVSLEVAAHAQMVSEPGSDCKRKGGLCLTD